MGKDVWGIVAAAGSGKRFGGDKLARRLPNGNTVLFQAIKQLVLGGVERIVVVGSPGAEHGLDALGEAVAAVVPGGAERADSIHAGLTAIPDDVALVAVHDGARPFVSAELVRACVDAARSTGAAVPVLPCVDTISVAMGDQLSAPLERQSLRRIQTPQVLRRNWLEAVCAERAGTDESSVLLRLGHPVATVPGEEGNRKVTHPNDLPTQPMRHAVGSGFDVHRFDPERPLYIGGLHLPGEPGLAGHSDADVLLHALVDAILGALGLGDIGQHFPPSEERWRGADSAIFVDAARKACDEAGGTIEHVDLTVIGERPKLAPHRDAIRQRVAALLHLPPSRTRHISSLATEDKSMFDDQMSSTSIVIICSNPSRLPR